MSVDTMLHDLKNKVSDFNYKIESEEFGVITRIGDGIAHIVGLNNCLINEILVFPNDILGIAFTLEEDYIIAILLDDSAKLREGDAVKRSKNIVEVPVGEELIGRVVDALGKPVDGLGIIHTSHSYPIERPAKSIMSRRNVDTPLFTGIKAIDSMIPIGLGQRELIIGDRKTGKTSIAIDTILNQKNKDIVCIYVAIGGKQSTTTEMVNVLQKHGAMDYTIVVMASSAESAALQYIAPFAGCSMGEYLMEQGKNVLIIYDDLSKHAIAYRTISLLLERSPGREAYPGDVFYLHSRLLERAAAVSKEEGGGSLTALPIVETYAGDISAYIPTNVISITDGQIFLETDLFYSGVLPAINPGISVSRVGGAAQISSIKKVSGAIKLLYSQYMELKSFAQFGNDLDSSTLKRLDQGQRIVAMLKQDEHNPAPIEKQYLIFFSLINNFLDCIPVDDVARFENELYEYVNSNYPEKLDQILNGDVLNEKNSKELSDLLTEFCKQFSLE